MSEKGFIQKTVLQGIADSIKLKTCKTNGIPVKYLENEILKFDTSLENIVYADYSETEDYKVKPLVSNINNIPSEVNNSKIYKIQFLDGCAYTNGLCPIRMILDQMLEDFSGDIRYYYVEKLPQNIELSDTAATLHIYVLKDTGIGYLYAAFNSEPRLWTCAEVFTAMVNEEGFTFTDEGFIDLDERGLERDDLNALGIYFIKGEMGVGIPNADRKKKIYEYKDNKWSEVGELTPEILLQEKTARVFGEVLPDEGYDGLSKVTVAVDGYYQVSKHAVGDEFYIPHGAGYIVEITNADVLSYIDEGNNYKFTVLAPGDCSVISRNEFGVIIGAWYILVEKQSENVYIVSKPVDFTLLADSWNGTTYTITTADYGEVGELQLGIPPSSSLLNAQTLEKCALTLPLVVNNYTKVDTDGDGDGDTTQYKDTTIEISAVTAPTIDVVVAIYGLLGGETSEQA